MRHLREREESHHQPSPHLKERQEEQHISRGTRRKGLASIRAEINELKRENVQNYCLETQFLVKVKLKNL